MLKRIAKRVRKQLLKIKWFKRRVELYKLRQKKQPQQHICWELIMSGQTMRDKDAHKTLATVSDDGVLIDYMDGRNVGQRYVNPLFMDSTNWGGMNLETRQ